MRIAPMRHVLPVLAPTDDCVSAKPSGTDSIGIASIASVMIGIRVSEDPAFRFRRIGGVLRLLAWARSSVPPATVGDTKEQRSGIDRLRMQT